MEKILQDYLTKHNITYIAHEHPAVFTVEESLKIKDKTPHIFHTKNLFIKDEEGHFFLVCMNAYKRLDLKALRDRIGAKKKLSFCTAEQLKQHLNLTPGSVSIFGMVHAKDVKLILDREIWEAPIVGFHPNINTATLELTHEALKKFYDSLKAEKEVIDLPIIE